MTAKKMILAAAGSAVFAGTILWIGPKTFVEQFSKLGWALPVLIAMGLVKHLIRTLAWQRALDADGVTLNFSRLLGVRVASQSVAYFSSMGGVVGDPLKSWLLRKTAGMDATIPATFAEAAVYWLTSLLIMTAGTGSTIAVASDQQSAFSLWLICLSISAGLMFLLLARTPWLPGLAAFVSRHKAFPHRWLAGLHKAGEFEKRIRSFRVRHPKTTVVAFGLDLLVQVTMLAEVWIVMAAAEMPLDFSHLFAIEAASRLVKVVSFYVPGRLGADEAGSVASFLMLGLDPAAGLALAVARRLQGLVWAALGLYWLDAGGAVGKGKKPTPSTIHAPSSARAAAFQKTKELSNASACFAVQD